MTTNKILLLNVPQYPHTKRQRKKENCLIVYSEKVSIVFLSSQLSYLYNCDNTTIIKKERKAQKPRRNPAEQKN